MPLYEYGCSACGRTSEISHRMSDPPATVCPLCGEPKLSKQVSAAGFRLKGAGWYETDFKSDGKRNLAGDASSGGADAGKSESPKSDTKSETKAETKTESKPAASSSSAGSTAAAS